MTFTQHILDSIQNTQNTQGYDGQFSIMDSLQPDCPNRSQYTCQISSKTGTNHSESDTKFV